MSKCYGDILSLMEGRFMLNYYAVKRGHNPGVYMTWNECKGQVEGYRNASYKRFDSIYDAEMFAFGKVKTKLGRLFDDDDNEAFEVDDDYSSWEEGFEQYFVV